MNILSGRELILVIFFIVFFIKQIVFRFETKKCRQVYDVLWAHRGFHFCYPENTIGSYQEAIKNKWGVELDIRILKDGNIICFHDYFTKRLIGVPGKFNDFDFATLSKKYRVKGSEQRIPLLKEVLDEFSGQVPMLVEIKGFFYGKYRSELLRLIGEYERKYPHMVYFHTKNVASYFVATSVFGKRVFWVCNPFRKRFSFIKGKSYKNESNKYMSLIQSEYAKTNEIEFPTPDDLSAIFISAIEKNDTIKEIIPKIAGIMNNYSSRVVKDHWLVNSIIIHRGALSPFFKEHSLQAFKACIDFAEKYQLRIAIEADFIWYKGEVVCYHDDRVSDKLGQAKSCTTKMSLSEAPKFSEVLELIRGHEQYVSLVIDIKDAHYKDRKLEKMIASEITRTGFAGNFAVQSFNPLVLMYFKEYHPDYIRGQIGHSLEGLIKYAPISKLPWIVNFILFDKSVSDYCVYDNSPYIWVLIKYNCGFRGRPVLVYAPKSELEVEAYIGKDNISNFIVENIATNSEGNLVINQKDWSLEYMNKFMENKKQST